MQKIKEFFVSHPIIAWNLIGIAFAILDHWVISIIFFVISLIAYTKSVIELIEKRKAEKKAVIVKEAESYIAEIKEDKKIPQISSSLFLVSGEHAFLQEKADLRETRAIRTSGGGFAGFRVAKGITIGGFSSSSESHQEWRSLDLGELTLTNKKIVFRGGKENRTIPIDKVIDLEVYADRIGIAVEGRTKSMSFSVKNPYIWKIAISIIKNVKNPLDLDGINLNIQIQ